MLQEFAPLLRPFYLKIPVIGMFLRRLRSIAQLVIITCVGLMSDPAAAAPPDASGHWAFSPVTNPAAPKVTDSTWPRGEIDHFILAQLEAKKLKPSPQADRRTLIRRLYFDLLGLPPTHAEVTAFERDPDEQAYAKLVDRLLASPQFGERWARHWLDVARYSDTKGYVFEESRDYPYAYSFRDWTIRAFNNDLPYDQFLVYQIAADRVATEEASKHHLAAMGFLTTGRRFLNREPDIIDDRIDVTFRGAMALTVACSRCHDHKYDPIPITDYYSLYGVFASSEEPKEPPLLGRPADSDEFREFEKILAEKRAKIDDYQRKRTSELRQPDFLARYLLAAYDGRKMKDEELKRLASSRKLLHKVTLDWRKYLNQRAEKPEALFRAWHHFGKLPSEGFIDASPAAWDTLKKSGESIPPAIVAKFDAEKPRSMKDVAKIYAEVLAAAKPDTPLGKVLHAPSTPTAIDPGSIYGLLETPGQQHIRKLRRCVESHKTKHAGAPPRAMVMVDRKTPKEPHVFERGDPGRRGAKVPRQFLEMLKGPERKPFADGSGRLEMAREISSRDNPLTARVWANRVWGHLLGGHLVDTPSDFGLRSDPPSHPALLDHMATQLMNEDWSTKKLIRHIVTSATYRQSSKIAPDSIDPENRLYARANRKRADFESFRDSILAVSGQLDLKQFGKPVEIATEDYSRRRTVYATVERQNLPPVFRTFDFASPDVHIPKRAETTVPQQALYMLNGLFAREQATALVDHADLKPGMKDKERLRRLYRRVFARDPDAEETADALTFVRSDAAAEDLGTWQYGYGHFDAATKRVQFEALGHFTGSSWQAGEKLPDPKFGWTSIHKTGGHPGHDNYNAIWRWTAPSDGEYEIRGTLDLPAPQSTGVVGALYARGNERLAKWPVAGGANSPTHLDKVLLKRGDELHFLVASGETDSFDSIRWNPGIRLKSTSERWVASDGFGSKNAKPKTDLWEQLAQALLASNEFAFID